MRLSTSTAPRVMNRNFPDCMTRDGETARRKVCDKALSWIVCAPEERDISKNAKIRLQPCHRKAKNAAYQTKVKVASQVLGRPAKKENIDDRSGVWTSWVWWRVDFFARENPYILDRPIYNITQSGFYTHPLKYRFSSNQMLVL